MFRLLSDLHLEFSEGRLVLPEEPDDANTILVLAGDIGVIKNKSSYVDFLRYVSPRFTKVIYIMGNHEYYRGSLKRTIDKGKDAIRDLENVFILENETLLHDGVAYICSTFWTDFRNGNPLAMNAAQMTLNDYKFIRTGPSSVGQHPYQRKLNTQDVFQMHMKSKEFVFDEIEKYKKQGLKTVVVTHHAPSWQSVHPMYMRSKDFELNSAYVSDLDYRIAEKGPDVWVHGHTHHSFDYMIENTRVVCNPRGYYKVEMNPEFDPGLTIIP